MAETWDRARLIADGFERVHIETEWYDGPRAGLADVEGRPHYFEGGADDRYRVWPAGDEAPAWEREQWSIFVRWNDRYEAGTASPDTHPGQRGVDSRYDELTLLLEPFRRMPGDARRMVGEVRFGGGARYRIGGPDYWIRWRPGR